MYILQQEASWYPCFCTIFCQKKLNCHRTQVYRVNADPGRGSREETQRILTSASLCVHSAESNETNRVSEKKSTDKNSVISVNDILSKTTIYISYLK